MHKVKNLLEIRNKIKATYKIEVDGGINQETSKICIKNGADILVAGSYIYGADDNKYEELINSIR